jgi:hypothetical protein
MSRRRRRRALWSQIGASRSAIFSRISLLEQDGLRINFEPGSTRKAVVSFTGLQLRPGLGIGQKGEFWQTRMHEDKLHPIFYLHDKKNSWYEANHRLVVSNLPGLLKPFDDVVAIGNSMGGFAAIRFSGFLTKCRQVVAFSPQFIPRTSRIAIRG